MSDHDVNDDYVVGALRDGLSRLPVPPPPPVEAVVARGRARRRRSGLAGMGVAAAGLAIALPVVITTVNRPASQVATSIRLGSGPVHVNLAAFSVDSNPNGTVSVRLASKQAINARQLRQILAQAGIPAVVNYGAFCATSVQPPGFKQVVSGPPANGTANASSSSSIRSTASADVTAMVIKPGKMPKQAELSIGYFPDHVAMTLVRVGGPLSCVATDPPGCNIPVLGQAVAAPPSGSDPTNLSSATTALPSGSTTTPPPGGPSPNGTGEPAVTAVPSTTTVTAVPGASATTSTAPAATTTLPAGAATSLPPDASTTVPAGTNVPQQALRRCPAPASGSSGVTGSTAGVSTTTPPSTSSS